MFKKRGGGKWEKKIYNLKAGVFFLKKKRKTINIVKKVIIYVNKNLCKIIKEKLGIIYHYIPTNHTSILYTT